MFASQWGEELNTDLIKFGSISRDASQVGYSGCIPPYCLTDGLVMLLFSQGALYIL